MRIQYGKGSGSYIYTDNQGTTMTVPRDLKNRHAQDIEAHIVTGYQVLPCDPESDNTIPKIKAEAQRRIVTWTITGSDPASQVYWTSKQLNAIARTVEFQNKKIAGINLTAQEDVEFQQISGFWDKVKVIRADSNLLERKYASGLVPATGIYNSEHWTY